MKRRYGSTLIFLGIVLVTAQVLAPGVETAPIPMGRQRIQFRSSLDGTLQDSYVVVPSNQDRQMSPRPVLVLLHTWSADLDQRQPAVEAEAVGRGWVLLIPNFRGPNNRPEACGSVLAQQDIFDALAWVRAHFAVDESRIYLLGLSGGGHMAMLLAGRSPDGWAAVSAWVGISDLTAWYREHHGDEYGAMMRACFGGAPQDNEEIAARYRERSPLTYLRPGLNTAIELAAGRSDPLVSVQHTLRAFTALAPGTLTSEDLAAINEAATSTPPYDPDPLLGRPILLRRTAGRARVTIFDGNHEWFPEAAIEWLAQHQR